MATETADDWAAISRPAGRGAAGAGRLPRDPAPGGRPRPRQPAPPDGRRRPARSSAWTGRSGGGGDVFAQLVAQAGDVPASLESDLARNAVRGQRDVRRVRDVPRAGAGAARPRQGGGRPRALRPRLALLPRHRDRPRRDLRVGLGGAAPHRDRDARDLGDPRRRRRDHRRRRRRTSRATRRGGSTARRTSASWMQELADRTLADMADTHFDIPEPIRRIECRIAPTHDGGIYYTPPSEDFTRPGRMWWSIPDGVDDVPPVARGDDRLPRGRARAITSSARRPPTARTSSTAGSAACAGSPATARAGRSTPSG